MTSTPCGKALVPFSQKGAPIIGRWADLQGELMACPDCGYLAFDPLPTEQDLSSYYGSQYWELGGSFEEAKASYEAGGYYRDAAATIVDLWRELGVAGKPLRAHEIGCGYGVTVHYLRRAGVEGTGSDLSSMAVEVARRLGNAFTEAMPLSEYLKKPAENRINFFFMSHSLEHMPDPASLVKEVYDHLEPGGVFLIRVPNGMHVTSRTRSLYEYTWLQYPDHIHYLTPHSSICLLEAAGFEIVRISTLPREDHAQLMTSALFGRTWQDLPDPSSLVRAVCDNWLGMELQIVARKSPAGVRGAPENIRTSALKFERRVDLMPLADVTPGDNLAAFAPVQDGASSWRYFELQDGRLVPLRSDSSRKRLESDAIHVHRALHYVPQGRTLRIHHTIGPQAADAPSIVRIQFSVILPHDEDGEFVIAVSKGGALLSTETYVTGRRHSRELFVAASPGEVLQFDVTTLKSAWPSIYLHASCRWIALAPSISASME